MKWAEFQAEVAGLLPTDADREGLRTFVDKLMRAACIDLQGNIERMQARTTTRFTYADVAKVGYASNATVPSQGMIRIIEAWLIRTATGGTFVLGHSYRITSIGTTDFVAIGATANTVGLIFKATAVGSGDGVAEEISPTQRSELGQVPWDDRYNLINGAEQASAIALDPFGLEFYVAPALKTGDIIDLTWEGIKMTFAAADVLPPNWDAEAAEAVSHYVSANVARKMNDIGGYNSYLRDFAVKRRGLYAREKQRQFAK